MLELRLSLYQVCFHFFGVLLLATSTGPLVAYGADMHQAEVGRLFGQRWQRNAERFKGFFVNSEQIVKILYVIGLQWLINFLPVDVFAHIQSCWILLNRVLRCQCLGGFDLLRLSFLYSWRHFVFLHFLLRRFFLAFDLPEGVALRRFRSNWLLGFLIDYGVWHGELGILLQLLVPL